MPLHIPKKKKKPKTQLSLPTAESEYLLTETG